ncbi:MAG: toprim domain-containing protein [Colwellia sp.]|jgi:hypothetical protein
MNSFEAKKIPIQNFLSKRGHEPSSTKTNEIWYKSPFRENDKTPSFKLNLLLNTWYDFSIGKGGTIIDLVSLMYNETVSDTLKRLSNDYSSSVIPKINIQPGIKFSSTKDTFKLEKVSDLENPKLIEYLESRNINKLLAKKYLKEIHFTITKTNSFNFALAIENELNGFEFRNVFMKGSINGKSYTLINPGNNKDIAIFEGFIDFLSFLTDHSLQDFQSTVLILNSVNLRNETLKVFEKHSYKKAYCFLDNDKAGKETFDFFNKELKIPIIDKSTIYKNFDDYNEYIKRKKL